MRAPIVPDTVSVVPLEHFPLWTGLGAVQDRSGKHCRPGSLIAKRFSLGVLIDWPSKRSAANLAKFTAELNKVEPVFRHSGISIHREQTNPTVSFQTRGRCRQQYRSSMTVGSALSVPLSPRGSKPRPRDLPNRAILRHISLQSWTDYLQRSERFKRRLLPPPCLHALGMILNLSLLMTLRLSCRLRL